jgi:hypothetical protein
MRSEKKRRGSAAIRAGAQVDVDQFSECNRIQEANASFFGINPRVFAALTPRVNASNRKIRAVVSRLGKPLNVTIRETAPAGKTLTPMGWQGLL